MSSSEHDSKLSSADIDSLHWGSLKDWVQLVRLPTSFTLISNCLAAFAITYNNGGAPTTVVIPILLVSLAAYWAGMILNDVVDLEEDAKYRPHRPLVRKRISPVVAGHVANGLLLLGPVCILGVLTFHSSSQLWTGAAFASAALLSMAIKLYNTPLKSSLLGPILMGSCRGLNILMVGATVLATSPTANHSDWLAGYALAMFTYIVGVTIYARKEEQQSNPINLSIGVLFEAVGLIVVASIPTWFPDADKLWSLDPSRGFRLLIFLIGLTVLYQGFGGVARPNPRKVQLAVRHALLTIILIDAAIITMWMDYRFGAASLLLLIPALISALRVRTT